MGTGRPLWLVVLGPRLPFVVLVPCHHWWVVLVPRCQLQVVLLGPHHFSWVEWLGAGCIVCGWWWCALVAPFVNGGGGAPSLVFMWHGRHHCYGVLSSLEGEGHGSFVSADAPSVIVLHWHPASFLCAVIVCPCSHVSLSLLHVPCRCCVSSPCHCPLPSLSLSCDVVVAVPSL